VEAQPGGLNRAGVCDEELDRLLYAQAETPDLDERAALFYAIEDLNRERAWWVPLCQIYDLWLVREGLSGLHPWRENPFWNVEEWIAE
jgi:ABC-type transport system substrate-binding protein